MLLVGVLEIPVTLLFVGLGVALWMYYRMNAPTPDSTQAALPYFIAHDVPNGVRGLFLVAVLAAAMSSLDSAINALATVTLTDLAKPWKKFSDEMESVRGVRVSQMVSVGWGLLLILVSLTICGMHQNLLATNERYLEPTRSKELLSLALGVMGMVYGPLLGVFILALYTRGGRAVGVISAMTGGLLIVPTLSWFAPNAVGWTWYVVFGAVGTVVLGLLFRSVGSRIAEVRVHGTV